MSFCAVCVRDLPEVTRREPLGRDDALVAVCDQCALEPVVVVDPVYHRVSKRERDGSSRAASHKRHRDDLASRGICTNGEKHGKATRGRLCEACYDKWWKPKRKSVAKKARGE